MAQRKKSKSKTDHDESKTAHEESKTATVLGGDRTKLPFRQTTVCFVVYGHRLVCKITKRYVKFPGGGVDEGETPSDAVIRELKEEIGAEIQELRELSSLTVDWTPEWTEGDPKREERYKKYRGEETFFFVAFVSKFTKPTSTEGDAWQDVSDNFMFTFPEVIAALEKFDRGAKGTNFSSFYAMQIACTKLIHMMIGVSKAQQSLAKEITGGSIPNVFTLRKYIN